ncbi:MAG: hypothetical protein QNJ32_21055 [Xenococcaceae cyanobacterium MO_167.B27]|nr:hypothetical protein [Xenococcaceae cyanobacterium MO_167.B27]
MDIQVKNLDHLRIVAGIVDQIGLKESLFIGQFDLLCHEGVELVEHLAYIYMALNCSICCSDTSSSTSFFGESFIVFAPKLCH